MISIEEVKLLENLKEELEKNMDSIGEKTVNTNYIIDSIQQFKRYFTNLDFTIEENLDNGKNSITHKKIVATYKNFKIVLLVPIDNIDRVWKLCIGYDVNSYKNWYYIFINNIGDYNIDIGNLDYRSQESIKNEISKKKYELEALKSMIESNYNCLFQLRNKQNCIIYDKCKNFMELLEKIFEYKM
ncbi:hypothetical protein Z968_08570 [Clostridium novyi A str. 4552]|uniref:Uncharacterized protein n=1 Tax=Clostridium novyi A str. 4552 TaxID=1444289 RepID=A0A0A0I4S1_CLONO|nr:hypothetical protein [Clostridium novyi]KGM95623.1 hypothetical protein Z968_08570 [Clostridium novyi A str. 4552]